MAILIVCGAAAGGADRVRDELIGNLASESYAEREEATEALWAEGRRALDALEEAARSRDPEMALRARDLLRKIDLGITPDTDPRIIQLTERYATSNQTQKTTIIHELRRLRGWRQILRLYANETDASTQESLARMVDGIALHAARERIASGDPDGAREYLEMVRETPGGMISLAAFHRAMGTLEAEIEAVGDPSGADDVMWLNALHRASGDARNSAESAREMGDERLAAVMEMLLGDPLPWLEHAAVAGEGDDAAGSNYAWVAAARWRGEETIPEFDGLRRQLRSNDEATRLRGMAHLFLLGEMEAAWQAYARHYPDEAFLHYDSLERIDDALRVIGLDPEAPDYEGYLGPLVARVCQPPGGMGDDGEEEDGGDRDDEVRRLVVFCNFLERRGMKDVLDRVVMPALLEFGGIHPPRFTDLMSELFATPAVRSGAPEFAMRVAAEWAGDDAQRWDEMMIAAFGEEHGYLRWRELLEMVAPDSGRDEQLRGLLALFGYTRDPENLTGRWMDVVWAHYEAGDDADAVVEALGFLSGNVTDIELIERMRQLNADRNDDLEMAYGNLLVDTALGRWEKAAEAFLMQIASLAERGDARAELHAYAAVCLRNAGRGAEAEAHEEWVEALVLGDIRSNLAVAQAYSFGRDYGQAMRWYRRAIMECDPGDSRFAQALHNFTNELLEHREFGLVASCTEVLAQIEGAETGLGITPFNYTRLRQQGDFARALSLPPERGDEVRRMLRFAHAVMPTDGALADHFFPALLESGLTDVHDELFEISWREVTGPLERFPDSDNTMNTAGWFASRSVRRLDEAMVLQKRALELHPRSPAYLDTLGEIHFAMGNREEAVRLGGLAMRYMPHDTMIIRQYERFRHGEFPGR